MAAEPIEPILLPWTTNRQLPWEMVVQWGFSRDMLLREVRPLFVLNSETMVVVSTIERDYTGRVMSWEGCMRPNFPTYSVHFKKNILGAWDPDTDLKFKLRAVLPGFVEFTAPMEAGVIAKFHAGGKNPANTEHYDQVCSTAYVANEPDEEENMVDYTYPGGERRRFHVLYVINGADKQMVFRCSNGVRMAVFLDTVLGTGFEGRVHDEIKHPERYLDDSAV